MLIYVCMPLTTSFIRKKTRMWANALPNIGDALWSNIGVALCSTPQSLADAHYYTVFQKNWTTKLMAVTLLNLNRFPKFFHC